MADDIKILIGADATPVERAVRILDNLEAELRKVERAEKVGLITKERARAETDRLTASMQKLKTVANGSVSDFDKFEKSIAGSGKTARRNEVAFQQAGYQIQDFIVQVQAGTNPLIAFSQQGSQLAGFFAGPWGASIGLGIAALSSFAMVLLNTQANAKSMKEQLDKLKDATSSYKTAVDDLSKSQEQLNEEYGAYASIAKDALQTLKQLAQTELDRKIKDFSKSIADTSGNVSVVNEKFRVFLGLNERFSGRKAQTMAQPMIDAMKALGEAEGVEQQLQALRQVDVAFKQITSGQKELTAEQEAFQKALSTQIEAYAKILGQNKEVVSVQEDYLSSLEKGFQKQEEFEQKALNALVDKLKAQGNLLAAEQLQVELAREVAVQKVLSTAKTVEEKNALVASAIAAADAAEQAVRLAYQTDTIKDDSKELASALNAAASAMDRMSSSSLNLHTQIAQAKAEAAALAAGLDVSVARNIAGAREKYQAEYLAASGAAQLAGDLDLMDQAQRIYNEQLEGLKTLETLGQANAAARAGLRAGAKTTDPIKSGTEYIERVLKPEIELRQRDILLSDEQQKRAKFEFDLRQKLDKYKDKASEKEIAAVMALYDQTVRLERASRLIDYAQGQMEDFFMSVVDGTSTIEDAFKGMLRNILLEIYRQEIVKPMAEGISGFFKSFLFSAKGNVFQGGSQVKAFANGGVVSGPTMFPMTSGVGVMGEAGPEAIMPLKRGANGKLGVEMHGGGSQQVIVNQSFNFSANGDESVKKIIAQAAPQIAQMTQQKIMDSRRRGGQMKATFS